MSQNVGGANKDLYALEEHFGMRSPLNNGLLDILDEMRLMDGINDIFQVNPCEVVTNAWIEDVASQLDVTRESTNIRIGTYSLKLTSTVASVGKVYTTKINAGADPSLHPQKQIRCMDWRNTDFIGFWYYVSNAAHFNNNGDLKFNIKNNGVWGTAIDVPANGTATDWKRCELDITSFSRDAVEAIRFENNNADAAEDVYIDEIIRYKFGNGKGPVGPGARVMAFPIKSGVTLTRGNIATLELDGSSRTTGRITNAATAAAVTDKGPVVIGGIGNDAGSVWGYVQIAGPAYLRASAAITAGYGVKWASGHQIAGIGNNEANVVFAKADEAAADADEDILCNIITMVTHAHA